MHETIFKNNFFLYTTKKNTGFPRPKVVGNIRKAVWNLISHGFSCGQETVGNSSVGNCFPRMFPADFFPRLFPLFSHGFSHNFHAVFLMVYFLFFFLKNGLEIFTRLFPRIFQRKNFFPRNVKFLKFFFKKIAWLFPQFFSKGKPHEIF